MDWISLYLLAFELVFVEVLPQVMSVFVKVLKQKDCNDAYCNQTQWRPIG